MRKTIVLLGLALVGLLWVNVASAGRDAEVEPGQDYRYRVRLTVPGYLENETFFMKEAFQETAWGAVLVQGIRVSPGLIKLMKDVNARQYTPKEATLIVVDYGSRLRGPVGRQKFQLQQFQVKGYRPSVVSPERMLAGEVTIAFTGVQRVGEGFERYQLRGDRSDALYFYLTNLELNRETKGTLELRRAHRIDAFFKKISKAFEKPRRHNVGTRRPSYFYSFVLQAVDDWNQTVSGSEIHLDRCRPTHLHILRDSPTPVDAFLADVFTFEVGDSFVN